MTSNSMSVVKERPEMAAEQVYDTTRALETEITIEQSGAAAPMFGERGAQSQLLDWTTSALADGTPCH